jgi:hypothetical protein
MAVNISSIERGIVFLMAPWSGPAVMASQHLRDYLAAHAPGVTYVSINVDDDPSVYEVPGLAGKIHGWGEAAVVRNGRVVFCTALAKDKVQFASRCDELLRAYER